MLTPICGFVDRCYLLRSWHIPRLAIFLLWIPTIITESQEVLATLIFIGTSPVSLDLWLFPSFFVCSKPIFVVSIPHVVSSVLFFCFTTMLAGFSFRFLVVIPHKTITIFEFSMGLAHKFPLLSWLPRTRPYALSSSLRLPRRGRPGGDGAPSRRLSSGCPLPCADSIWVCLKIVYPYTQWLMIIIPTKWL